MTRQEFDAAWIGFRPQLCRELIQAGARPHEAEDAIGDAYLALVDALPRYTHRSAASAYAWMRQAAINKVRDIQRRRTAALRDVSEVDESDPIGQILDDDVVDRVVSRIDDVGLSRPERVAFVGILYGVDRKTLEAMLGVTDACLRQHLYKARQRVRETIADNLPGDTL